MAAGPRGPSWNVIVPGDAIGTRQSSGTAPIPLHQMEAMSVLGIPLETPPVQISGHTKVKRQSSGQLL